VPRSLGDVGFGNRLLDMLPPQIGERLRPHLEPTALPANLTVHEPDATLHYAFFPTGGLISLVATVKSGASIEVAMIGKEGMFSASSILGDDRPAQRAMVQIAGGALRIPARVLQQEAQADAALRALLLRYAQVILSTAMQGAACNRLHLLEQRCARWLLSAHDRAEADTFAMTHEFLAQSLQADGIIAYNHGAMTIVDRKGLEAASCECYQTLQEEYRRLIDRQP
jgi:CRP-like cAMP-binding protein